MRCSGFVHHALLEYPLFETVGKVLRGRICP